MEFFHTMYLYIFWITVPSVPSSMGPAPSLSSQSLSSQPGDLLPGASPRKKPRKQQHVISTEETEMMETNSTDEERASSRPPGNRPERHESPPREYVGELMFIFIYKHTHILWYLVAALATEADYCDASVHLPFWKGQDVTLNSS